MFDLEIKIITPAATQAVISAFNNILKFSFSVKFFLLVIIFGGEGSRTPVPIREA